MIHCSFTDVTDADCGDFTVNIDACHAAFYVAFTNTKVDKTHNGEKRLAAVVSFQENKLTTGCLSCTNVALEAAGPGANPQSNLTETFSSPAMTLTNAVSKVNLLLDR